MRRIASLVLGMSIGLAGPAASAADPAPTPEQRALAEALFRSARDLMDQGRIPEACASLEESYRVAPALGTLLNMAVCHEEEGRLATAMFEFQQAQAQALQSGRQDRVVFAREHLEKLLPRVPSLMISVPPGSQRPGLVVRRDSVEVPVQAWGVPVFIDPGQYQIIVAAPGHLSWRQLVAIETGGRTSITVPPLERAPVPVASAVREESRPRLVVSEALPAKSDPDTGARQALRTTAWVTGAVGVSLIGLGAWYGLSAVSKRAESDAQCPDNRCSSEGVELNVEAQRLAIRSNLAFEGGLVLSTIAALLVYSTWPSTPNQGGRSKARVGASVDERAGYVFTEGVF